MSAITERPRLDFDITDNSELERIASENGIDIAILREISRLGILTIGHDGTFSLQVKNPDGQITKILCTAETCMTDLTDNTHASVY